MACAARAVAPLLATTVSEDGVKRRGPLTRGFTCVEIGEAELPWVVKGI